jgi:acylphosphatase
VQGVFFRASAKREADRLGIQGYAKNLPDGRVEVLASGESQALDRFQAWLAKGPPMGRVDDLRCEETDTTPGGGFLVL